MHSRISERTLAALAVAAVLAAGCPATREEAPLGAVTGGHDHADHDHAGHEPARDGVASAAAGDQIAHYTCSMHPSVRNAGPGDCPICSMDLLPVTRRELDSGEIVLNAVRRQQIGVTTARAERRQLAVSVRAVGAVTYDQTRLTDVTLKVGGWIGELHANRLGQPVRQGEPLFTLYSPELFAAQQEYLTALESLRNARRVGSSASADFLLQARRQRLRLWDLTPDQIERLEERGLPVELHPILSPASGHVIEKNVVAGGAVSPGTRLLRIAGLDRVWVEAEVYESELALLAAGDRATVTLPYLPGRRFAGRITFVYPWLDGATRTGRVRIELPNPDLALKPEMYAEVVFESTLGERLAVPEEAILYAGDRRYVFLDLGRGRLRPQAVTPGQRAGEWVEILDGLAAGDAVVTSGNFLIAAEARLKLALDHWNREPELAAAGNGVPAAGHDGHHEHHDHGHAAGHGEAAPAAAPPPPAAHEGHHEHHDHGHAAGSGEAPAAAPPPPAADGHQGHHEHGHPAAHDGRHGHGHPAAPGARR